MAWFDSAAKREFRQWKNCCLKGDCPRFDPCEQNDECIKKCETKCKEDKPGLVIAAVSVVAFGYVVGLGVGYLMHRFRGTESATSFSEFLSLAKLFG